MPWKLKAVLKAMILSVGVCGMAMISTSVFSKDPVQGSKDPAQGSVTKPFGDYSLPSSDTNVQGQRKGESKKDRGDLSGGIISNKKGK